jgi:hypothetical protein
MICQIAYNFNADNYLVVWEDYSRVGGWSDSDIHGQFLHGDGTLQGDPLVICGADSNQYWPRLAFDPDRNRYLVVFEDYRHGWKGDVRGVFIGADGSLIPAPTSDADGTFIISGNAASVYTCSVAYNFRENRYLVVWGDFRNDPTGMSFIGNDVYGQLVAADGTLLPPPQPAEPAVNFPIAYADFQESVADVTYSPITNEFFVVYGTELGTIMGQRIDHLGRLLAQDGSITPSLQKAGADPGGIALSPVPAIPIASGFTSGPDNFQARVEANNEFSWTEGEWCECEVVWKGVLPPRADTDIYGQRIGFFKEADKYVARYLDLKGQAVSTPAFHEISVQKDYPSPMDLAFSARDNEFLVVWGDPRDRGYQRMDLYSQRLAVNDAREMIFLGADRKTVVTANENIPLIVGDDFAGGILGVAHNLKSNEFVTAFEFEKAAAGAGRDIYGCRISGSALTAVKRPARPPEETWLAYNYPNPFNPQTMISYHLSQPGPVRIAIFDRSGRLLVTLEQEARTAGTQNLIWKGCDQNGKPVPSGLYLYRITAGDQRQEGKMTLVR